MSLFLCAERTGKCPLRTQHRLVEAHSREQPLFFGHHSLPNTVLPVQRVIYVFYALYLLLKSHLS